MVLSWVDGDGSFESGSTGAVVVGSWASLDAQSYDALFVEAGSDVAGSALGYSRRVAKGLVDCAYALDV